MFYARLLVSLWLAQISANALGWLPARSLEAHSEHSITSAIVAVLVYEFHNRESRISSDEPLANLSRFVILARNKRALSVYVVREEEQPIPFAPLHGVYNCGFL